MSQGSQTTRRFSSERGEGKLKAIIVTVVLVCIAYSAFKLVPPYMSEYQLADKMQETARFGSVTRINEDQIRETIWKVVQDLEIPATKEDIKVTAAGGHVTIAVDYTVPVDLMVYKANLHFTPSSENKALF